MTVNMRSTNETVHTFATVARALDLIPSQDNLDGFVIVFDKNKPDANQEAEFYGHQDDFIDFVLAKVVDKAHSVVSERNEGDAMKLHGIKLYPLRRYTPNAAAVYQLVAGVMYNANSLVPVGVNGRFEEIIAIEGKMPTGFTVGDLMNAWLDFMKTRDD